MKLQHSLPALLVFLLLPTLFFGACSAALQAPPQGEQTPSARAAAEVRSALVRGEWKQACTLLDERLRSAPEQGDLWLYLKGVALVQQGERAAALAAFSEIEPRFAQSALAVKARFQRAELLRAGGDAAAAERIYEDEAQRLRSEARQGELARIYFELADGLSTPSATPGAESQRLDYDAAYGLYAGVLELGAPAKDRARALRRMSLCKERAQQWEACAGDCERFLARFDPAHAPGQVESERAPGAAALEELLEVRLRQARALLAQGRLVPARRALEDLAQDTQAARAARGAYAELARSLDAAATARVARLEGDARLAIADTYRAGVPGEARLAVAALRRFLVEAAGHPRAAFALRSIATLEAQHQRTEQALQALLELEQLPAPAGASDAELEEHARMGMQAVLERGNLLVGQKRFDEASAAYRDYVARFPAGPDWSNAQKQQIECEYARAADHQAGRRFPPARAAWNGFLLAHPLDPRAADIAAAIGDCFAGEAKDALHAGAEPGAVDDGRARAAGLSKSAIEEWRRAAQRFPGTDAASRALLEVGKTLEFEGKDLDGAVAAYRQCSFGASAGEAQQRLAALTRPELALVAQGVWRQGGKPRVTAQVRNLDKLRLQVYRLDLEAFFRKNLGARGVEDLDLDLIAADVTQEVALEGFQRYARLERAIELPFEGPGTWVVALSGGELRATTLVIASQLDVLVKAAPRELFVFAEDVARGAPASGTRVLVALPLPSGARIVELETGADGTARAALDESCPAGELAALALRGAQVAALGFDTSGLALAQPVGARALVYTDRPAYRPGEQLRWRAIVRDAEDPRSGFTPGTRYRVEVLDPAGRALEAHEAELSAFGTLHGELALDAAAPAGAYRVQLTSPRGNVFGGAFEVSRYQLQKLDLEFRFERRVVQRGEPVEGRIRAAWYYGEPLPGAAVRLALPDGSVQELVTDAQGEARFRFETRDLVQEGQLGFSATLATEGITRTDGVRLALREYTALLRVPRELVQAGESLEAELSAFGPEGEPLARTLVFTLLRRESAAGGTWSEVELLRRELATDAGSGKARVAVELPRGGSYVLRAEALDRFGTPVLAEARVTAVGEEDELRVRLIAPRGELALGAPAEIEVVNRSGAGLALFTLEADGVLHHELVTLPAGSSRIPLQLDARALPRVWAAIARMDGARLHQHSLPLDVVRKLDLALELLEPAHEPGGPARLRVRARDQLGQPVAAELSLAVVDEALFDLFPERVQALTRVFDPPPRSRSNVSTAASSDFSYAGSTRTISADVLREARAQEQQQHFRERYRSVQELADELVADAAQAPAPSMRESLALEETESGTSIGVGAHGFSGRKAGRGGAATKSKAGAPAATEELPESTTAFWTATLVTGADGTATVEFELPGQSTRWRATCRGVGPQTLVGETSTSFASKSELFLELVAPPALVEGDTPRIVARVHDATGLAGALELALRVEAGERTSTFPARVELGQGHVHEFVFEPLEALPACGTLKLRLEAHGTLGGRERALAKSLEVAVRPWGVEGAASASGVLQSETAFDLALDPARDWSLRELELEFGPSLQRLLVGEALGESEALALRAGCLPPGTLADAAAELYGLAHVIELAGALGSDAGGRERLFERARGRITELLAAQRPTGGWGWSLSAQGETQVESSALALSALASASAAGLAVPDDARRSAASFLAGAFRDAAQEDDERKAMISWALALDGRGDFAAANRLHRDRAGLSPAALAYTTLALVAMERAPMAAEVAETLAQRLGADPAARKRALTEQNRAWNAAPGEMRALAACALSRALPQSPLLPALVEELLADRPWAPARMRGFALAALAWHVQHVQPAQQRSRVVVEVEGLGQRTLELAPDRPGATLSFRVGDAAPRVLHLRLRLEGSGRPHWAAVLRGFSRDTKPAADSVLRVLEQRELAAPPLYRGREIPTGFGVLREARTWTNLVEHLELGRSALCRVHVRAAPRSGRDPAGDFLLLEVPIPAGTRVLEDSLRDLRHGWRLAEGKLLVELGALAWDETLEFRLLGTQPGRYRVLPALLRSAYAPGRSALGTAHELEVLPRGVASPDAYRATPDELFHLGSACYAAGERERARALLEQLMESCGTQLEDQPLRETAEMLLYLAIERDDARAIVRNFEVLKEKNPELTIPFERIVAVGAAYRRLDEHERALLIFKATLEETFGKDLKVLGALDAAGNTDAALRTFARLLRDYPDFPAELEAELALSDRLLKLAPKAAEDASLRKAGRDRAALSIEGVQLLQRFLALHPRDPLAAQAGLNLVDAFLGLEDYERTAQTGRELSAVYSEPRSADAFLYAAAVADWYRGQDAQALELLKRIADSTWKDSSGVEHRSPNRDLALYILAQIHHARQEFGSAAGYYKEVENLFADARETLLALREKSIALPEVTRARPGQKLELVLTHRNVARAELLVYPVDLMTLYLREKTLAHVAGIELAGISPALRSEVALGQDGELRASETRVALDLKQPGAYLVIARGEEQHASGLVLVSDLELEVREDADIGRLRIQLVDAAGKGFVRGADVRVVGSASGEIVSGKTDPRGLFTAEGLSGAATVIARLGERQYAFFRGQRALNVRPSGGTRQELHKQLDQQAYLKNVLDQNDLFQNERANKLQGEILRDRKGVQVQQVK